MLHKEKVCVPTGHAAAPPGLHSHGAEDTHLTSDLKPKRCPASCPDMRSRPGPEAAPREAEEVMRCYNQEEESLDTMQTVCFGGETDQWVTQEKHQVN